MNSRTRALVAVTTVFVAAGLLETAAAADEGPPAVVAQVKAMILQQAKDWNSGDLEAYMDHYWRSENLSFSAQGSTRRGWEATRAEYLDRYPAPQSMGRIEFLNLEVTLVSDDAAFALGDWSQLRNNKRDTGNFTLLLRKFAGEWKIVHDHTSVSPTKRGRSTLDLSTIRPEDLREGSDALLEPEKP